MTRRTLLAATAGAVTGAAIGAERALAALAPGAPQLGEVWVGRLAPPGATVALGRSADLVGVRWQGPRHVPLALRYRLPGGGWSRWAPAGDHAHGPDAPGPGVAGDPVWTGGTTAVQLMSARRLEDVRLRLVDVSGGVGARRLSRSAGGALAAGALPLAEPRLTAGPGQPAIIARAAWARGVSHPRVAPGYGAVKLAFVHHTDNPNGYSRAEVPAMLRAIYTFHRYVNGWDDIGYNFVIDLFGRVFEARAGGIDEPVVGAHAGGYNLYSTGVAVLGSFGAVTVSAAARTALCNLLAWKLALHGVPAQGRVSVRVNPAGASFSRFPAGASVSLPHVAGHRDADATDCPGSVLYAALPSVRRRVRTLAPRPVRLSLALAPEQQPAPTPPGTAAPVPAPVPAGRPLAGTLAFLDGTPIAGATVLLQARQVSARGETVVEQTLAQASTDAAGAFALPGEYTPAARGGLALRALFAGAPGAGAAVSEALYVTAPASA